jgi:hypothetical protein
MTGHKTIKTVPVTECNFAPSGTYGHECGKPATHVAIVPSKYHASGYYYGGRCPECSTIKGGENKGATIVPLNGHVNTYNVTVWD